MKFENRMSAFFCALFFHPRTADSRANVSEVPFYGSGFFYSFNKLIHVHEWNE